MVSSELYLPEEDDDSASTMKEMIGGCCVCSDERGWAENPLVYCDGHGCNVAVHQACYGIVQVPTGPWFCRKCESQERAARVRCELCPHKDGALKRTDNGGWAHVVCALYIPEVEFANVSTMEPIVLQSVPHERYNKTCYICEEQGRESKAATGACMTCNKHGCRQAFHVTCAQFAGLLCEEQGSDADNVKYCGYCKYHYSKLKHKERDRHKPKHKKSLELSPSLVPALMVSSEKSYNNSSSGGSVSSISSAQKRLDDSGGRFTNANFQEVPSHSSSSSKDGGSSDGKSSEGKTKKSSSHGTGLSSGSRGRKSVPGKPHGPVVTTATSCTVPSASSPFQQGLLLGCSTKSASSGSVVQPTSDFLSFSDATLRTSESYTPSFGRSHVKSGSEGGASEGMVGLSTFSMLSQSSSSGKHYENCHPAGELGGLTAASYKRPQPSSSSSSATSSSSTGEDGVKKKKRGNWKNRYGPCYTSQDGKTTDTGEHGAALPLSTSSSPSSMSMLGGRGSAVSSTGGVGAGGAGSSSLGIQKSPSLLRNGSLQSMAVSSPPAGPGSYSSSSDVACPVPSVVLGGSLSGSNSDPVPTHQSVVTSMPTLTSLPPAAPFTSTSSTHSNLLPGSFNLAPSHMFGNRLNPNSAMAALIAQSESSPADQELGDGALGFSRRGNSPKANLSPRSPLSGLHIRYDSSGPLVSGLGSGTDSLPPVATSIDQLLERQWNDGQQFLLQQGSQEDVLGMLKSLHQLQVENRRLEEQIRTLTMKKERLQLLSAQLSVPFTPTSTTATTASSPLYPGNTHTDMLHSKNIQLGSSVLTDSSQPLPTQDPLSGGHSSRSSTSSLSTPPSAAHSPPQQQVNGVGMAGVAVQPGNANSSLPAIAGVTGLMGDLQGNHLTMSGIVGALNGVIQSSPSLTQNTSSLTTYPSITSASLPNSLNNSSGTTVKTSAARLLTEQHRQILLHQHQHQLQQLFSSQQPTPEQQQVLLYQLMQQQQQKQQQQQQNDVQLPINSLLPGTQPTITNNPFLAMHDSNASKTGRLGDKSVSLTGQEKT
ncbi:protein AF-10 isoform X1 [Triplophysa rosa]|uniref:protein AF-10 isoform X1 n=1 Tax=Triplophysa rosa TaxID=992332 RepID=UPI002545C8CF|nr:protein AF-10 isoform X1 [Triplophysa rosa]